MTLRISRGRKHAPSGSYRQTRKKSPRIERLKKKGLYISDLKQVPYLMMKRRLRMGLGSGTLTDAEMEVARSLGMC